MEKICALSGQKFTVTPEDEAFYARAGMPMPTLCPLERRRRRLAWRNESNLYWRTCDGTGARILSVFSPEKPYTVYDYDYWVSDNWDPMDYGMVFDFTKTFTEQFDALLKKVPQVARSAFDNTDSPYVNQAGQNKNAYMVFEADYTENCSYGWHITDSKHCLDCDYIERCQDCYGCVSCIDCSGAKFLQNCTDCHDSYFLKNCVDCTNCYGCANLKGKQFHFKNEPLSEADYLARIESLGLSSSTGLTQARREISEWFTVQPHPHCNGFNFDNSTGDYLYNAKNCQDCYFLVDSENAKFVNEARNVQDTYDMDAFGSRRGVKNCYEVHEIGGKVDQIYFSDQVWSDCSEVFYSKCCTDKCTNLFGCIGLRGKSHCIFNVQYSPEEYETLKTKIMAHMKETPLSSGAGSEWGEFLSPTISPFGYNETVAQEYYPLLKSEAADHNCKWSTVPAEETYQGPSHGVPDAIKDADLTICDQILNCASTGQNYRILQSEYNFYKKHDLPIPSLCPFERHRLRDDLRNRRRLYERSCDECHASLKSTYGPQRTERVLCHDCYKNVMR